MVAQFDAQSATQRRLPDAVRGPLMLPMTLESVPPLPGENALGHNHLFRHDRLAFLRGAAEVGDVTRMRFIHRWALVVSSPEAAHEILVEQARKFEKSPGFASDCTTSRGRGCSRARGSSGSASVA